MDEIPRLGDGGGGVDSDAPRAHEGAIVASIPQPPVRRFMRLLTPKAVLAAGGGTVATVLGLVCAVFSRGLPAAAFLASAMVLFCRAAYEPFRVEYVRCLEKDRRMALLDAKVDRLEHPGIRLAAIDASITGSANSEAITGYYWDWWFRVAVLLPTGTTLTLIAGDCDVFVKGVTLAGPAPTIVPFPLVRLLVRGIVVGDDPLKLASEFGYVDKPSTVSCTARYDAVPGEQPLSELPNRVLVRLWLVDRESKWRGAAAVELVRITDSEARWAGTGPASVVYEPIIALMGVPS